MKIGIYHPFYNLPDNYSLANIVREQMLMITENDHECHLFTHEGFKDPVPDKVKIHPVMTGTYEEILGPIEEVVKDLDYVFTHDVVYLSDYKDYDRVIRELAPKHPNVKWLHWSHSAPNPSQPRKPIKNSIYVGLNKWDLERLAEQYGVPEANCRLVYNSVSPDVFAGWHWFTRKLVDKYNLLDCDVLMVAPFDTGRWEPKGGPKICKLIEKLRKRKLNAKVVFVNAAANDDKRRKIVQELRKKHGTYAIFTSLEDKRYEEYVPRRVVWELMTIGNVFPLLSVSEGCSLTMLEAGLAGMIVILNADFPPFLEFGRTDLVFWMKVSSDRAVTNYGPQGEDGYYEAAAQNLHAMLERHTALRFKNRIQKRFNRKFIWKNQLEPLLLRT